MKINMQPKTSVETNELVDEFLYYNVYFVFFVVF